MTPRAALLQLARGVAQDLAGDRPSDGLRGIGPVLASSSASVLVLLDLLISEARKKRPNDDLVTALLFMVREALNESRMRSEGRDLREPTVADDLRAALSRMAAAGRLTPELLLMVAQQFAAAKLDVGDELRTNLVELSEVFAATENAVDGPEAITEHLAEIAGNLDNDPFGIHDQLSEVLSAYPAEQRLVIIGSVVTSDVPAMREAALGWLLDPDPHVARSVARMLHAAVERGLLSAASAGRLVIMRNWLDQEARKTLDSVGRRVLLSGETASSGGPVQIGTVMASGCDGAGAQSFFVLFKRGRKFGLASLLVKHGSGVRDAWVRDGLSKREADLFLREITGELQPFDASLDIVRTAIGHALAVGIDATSPAPFSLVHFIEIVGLGAVQPAHLSTEQIIGQLLRDVPPDRTSAPAVTRALAASKRWPDRYVFVASWFEDIDSRSSLLTKAKTRKQRQDIVLTRILPDQRSRWAALLAWTAAAAQDEPEGDHWIDMALVAREILGQRPLKDIPILSWIAENTIDVLAEFPQA